MAIQIFKKQNFINTLLKPESILFSLAFLLFSLFSIQSFAQNAPIKLIVLDPGHGHATYMQGRMYEGLDPEVHVYAPAGPDVETYLKSINGMNSRSSNPTKWKMVVYTGADYLERMLAEKKGNAVIISGNNSKKAEYMRRSIEAGIHVLADKPLAVTPKDFEMLKKSFKLAKKKKVLIFDPMDLRYDISNILQKELAEMPELFGTLKKGSVDDPSLIQENLHHFLKFSGTEPARRPAWFFDIEQQGHGITDVSTHLVDMTQWAGFPEVKLKYKKDIKILSSKEWATDLTPSEFKRVTRVDYPDYLKKYLKDSILSVLANGEINYTIKGVHAKVTVNWKYREPAGSSDTHFALMRGTKADLELRQGAEENYRATLYIKSATGIPAAEFTPAIEKVKNKLQQKYPGLDIIQKGNEWIVKPGTFKRTNSAEVAIGYILNNTMPAWEVPNMIAKYYTTTGALGY
ncbi:MAG: putative oxidoreductase C-terminal domain-containing protein [Daejeonella sp.]|uniref:putative oxidoreductase C-terminal domain-containing protein n=1 Tax=Daejeonella sp. TaxID=2805397 RepID=UPI00273261E0|nr:putative oxidoreductase C-terminal domain-containing protein [Daejeonella sp.]MDP3468696.1 putative oxidoreductase C-terminal domain-containing protein [Daejeonella sp.]